MFLSSVLLLLAGVVLSECKYYSQILPTLDDSDDNTKIVGGVQPRRNAYPFMAKLYVTFNGEARYGCGGALINNNYILTAAHCVVDDEGRTVTSIEVLLGAHAIRDYEPQRIRRYAESFVTADYDPDTKANDVALIKLGQSVTYNNVIKPLCLARSGSNYERQMATVAGWGTIGSDQPSSSVLLHVQLPVLSDATCSNVYGRGYYNDVMLCAGYLDGTKDSCQGDSGGPLFVNTNQGTVSVGVVSFGYGCAYPGVPGVYAEVQRFIGWIQQNSADGGSVCVV